MPDRYPEVGIASRIRLAATYPRVELHLLPFPKARGLLQPRGDSARVCGCVAVIDAVCPHEYRVIVAGRERRSKVDDTCGRSL